MPEIGQARADQRVGEMQRRKIDVAAAHVFRPGLIETDDRRLAGIEFAHDFEGHRREAEFFLFAERKHFGRVHAAGGLPKIDLAAVSFDGLTQELRGEFRQALEIVFPER